MAKKGLTITARTPDKVQVRDSFETPRYAVELLIPFIPKNIKWIWEPACGSGRIVQVLTEHGYGVYPSDIKKSDGWVNNHIHNFLLDERPLTHYFAKNDEAIITNPPFSVKKLFIEKAFEYNVPFAMLINADYSGEQISWIERGCEKIIPNRRINYLTPNIVERVNQGEFVKFLAGITYDYELNPREKYADEANKYKTIDEIPSELLHKYSSSQFHSMWLTWGFGIGKTETFIDLPRSQIKENIL